jgi:hypothetical protein
VIKIHVKPIVHGSKRFQATVGAWGPLGGSRHQDPPPKHAQPGPEHEEHASLEEKISKKYQVAQVFQNFQNFLKIKFNNE